jgi:hypothetical protein
MARDMVGFRDAYYVVLPEPIGAQTVAVRVTSYAA